MDKLRRALSGERPDDQQDIISEVSEGIRNPSSLSWSTRIKGFAICFGLGCILSLMGSGAVFMMKYRLFGALYTLGNVISLCSTCFLMGPVKQIKGMFAPTRLIATIIVLVSFALTLTAGFYWKKGGLCLIFVAVQFLAMTWYSISYIPYARDAVKSCVGACVA